MNNWQIRLRTDIQWLCLADHYLRTAIIGVGGRLLGDDAVGSMIVRSLRLTAPQCSHLLHVNAGLAPENHTGLIMRFRPALILLIDAADMNTSPGTVRLHSPYDDWPQPTGTHKPSLALVAQYLQMNAPCHIRLLAIQPASIQPLHHLSLPVKQSARQIIHDLYWLFSGHDQRAAEVSAR